MRYIVDTSLDLKVQKVFRGDTQIEHINNPKSAFEDQAQHIIAQSMSLGLAKLEETEILLRHGTVHCIPPIRGERFPLVSMTHYILADTLKEQVPMFSGSRVFADIGCGAGFLGHSIISSHTFGKVIFADLFPESINAAMEAYVINNNNIALGKEQVEQTPHGLRVLHKIMPAKYVDFKVGDASVTLAQTPIDIGVSCPVYIPGYCEVFPQAYELFANIMKNAAKENLNGTSEIYFGHSSLSLHKVQEAAEKTGGALSEIKRIEKPINFGTTDSITVQNKVPLSANVEYLKPYGLKVIDGEGYHDIMVSKIEYKNK